MLIILDRDGVINQDSDDYIKSPEEWIAIPGSLNAIAQLNKAGHQVVVATNQSGIGRGLFSEATLTRIHQKMQNELAKVGGHLDGIFYCPHHPDANCQCRKPKPGLLSQIAAHFNIDLATSIVIGDSPRDIEAANAAGCKAILVKTGKTLQPQPQLLNIPVFNDLAAAVNAIIQNSRSS